MPEAHLCECGCGQPTPLVDRNRPKQGHVKGQPMRFIRGHNGRGARFYRKVVTVHRRNMIASDGRRIALHRLRAERALGRPLPNGVEVHHADGTIADAAPLVICQNQAYHKLLHTRMRILRAGGDPNRDRVCRDCGPRPKEAFGPDRRISTGVQAYCRACRQRRVRERKVA